MTIRISIRFIEVNFEPLSISRPRAQRAKKGSKKDTIMIYVNGYTQVNEHKEIYFFTFIWGYSEKKQIFGLEKIRGHIHLYLHTLGSTVVTCSDCCNQSTMRQVCQNWPIMTDMGSAHTNPPNLPPLCVSLVPNI